jgi:hypothetical protein
LANKRLCIHYNPDTSGCDLYRSLLPARHLRRMFQEQGVPIEIKSVDMLQDEDKMDGLMIHRVLPDAFTRHILARATTGTVVIHDTDDLLIDLPEWNPVRLAWKQADTDRWHALTRYATLSTASTQPLADRIRPDTAVLPNLIDMNDWRGFQKHPQDTQRVRILWSGSDTHRGDIELIVEPLRRIMDEFGDKVQVVFFGHVHPELKMSHVMQIAEVKMVPLGLYAKTLMDIRPHICLGPLQKHPFNSAKSNCKWLEYSAAGGAFVYSKGVEAYEDSVGVACETEDDWYYAIKVLVTDHEQRKSIAAGSTADVVMNWTWQNSPQSQKWADTIRQAMGV